MINLYNPLCGKFYFHNLSIDISHMHNVSGLIHIRTDLADTQVFGNYMFSKENTPTLTRVCCSGAPFSHIIIYNVK